MTLRIKTKDFDSFAGFKHTDNSHTKYNERLNEYINLFKTNKDIIYFQIECEENTPIHLIAYIVNAVGEKHFIRTDFDTDGKNKTYWLCFYKKQGQWLTDPYGYKNSMCSLCGAIGNGASYCGHCGAEMISEGK